MTSRPTRYDLGLEELAPLLEGEPAFRAQQLYHGLYRELAQPSQLSALPKALRERLARDARLAAALELVAERRADGGATTKWLFALHDGAEIETVLMHYERRSTACVSSQAGCAMGCSFCATGQQGYTRQLSRGEILEQVVWAARAARATGRRLDHVVFMGMGEPLANYPNVLGATVGIVRDLGIAARHVTISTVGIVPGILRLAAEALQVNLAVSLHGANDALRDELVPINRRYGLSALMAACETYVASTHRRVSFEWALIADKNDRRKDAIELAGLARPLRAHVNVIPLNPTRLGPSRGLVGSPPARVAAFCDALAELGVKVTVRQTRGQQIDAACGQLAAKGREELELAGPEPRRRALTTRAAAPAGSMELWPVVD